MRRILNPMLVRAAFVSISITLPAAYPPHLAAQQLSTQAPHPQTSTQTSQQTATQTATQTSTQTSQQASAEAPPSAQASTPDGFSPLTPQPPPAPAADIPIAHIVQPPDDPAAPTPILTADTQTYQAGIFTLDGAVVITFGDRTLQADHIVYHRDSGDLEATGHLVAIGGRNDERIEASHGTLNLKTQAGRFYDVRGSVGVKPTALRAVYTSGNPFLFTGRIVVKTGPASYDIFDGTVTSCQLPHPDWQLGAALFQIGPDRATARNSTFRLIDIPLLYLPYVTHAVNPEVRQTGFLIPFVGETSKKGFILGEDIYFAINRSTDLTVGAQFFSLRGWEQNATFRYRGRGNDFARAHYTGLLDRLSGAANQGGEDAIFSGRRDLSPQTRLVADIEYLSSFTYRAAFTENFNQAVSSDILSRAFAARNVNGYNFAAYADRYEGLKRIPVTSATGVVTPGEQIRIFHVPTLDLSSVDRTLGRTGLTFSFASSIGGLKRVQPNFQTGGVVQRIDLHPELALPIHLDGWNLRPSVALRDTFYSRSRLPPPTGQGPVQPPVTPQESTASLNRSDVELQVEARAPVVERTFSTGTLPRLLNADIRHTIEPAFTYRLVRGVDNFLNILRFDDQDIVSDTHEIQYGVTQRLFLHKHGPNPCAAQPSLQPDGNTDPETREDPLADSLPGGITDGSASAILPRATCGTHEWISWRLTQKYFFDPTFGGAVQKGRRNLFDTTLNLSGVAFLTEPREISPLVSRLRLRLSDTLDFEWDADYDTGAKKFTAGNIFIDAHRGATFGGFSYARLNAPGRAYSQGIASAVSDFSQLRLLAGYGNPLRPGLSVAANAGLDLNVHTVQYAALQTSYNWNCCGFSVEYRKYELGSVRNENAYRFNFTLANIGTAGNLKRAARLF